jgi:hypothetical protein
MKIALPLMAFLLMTALILSACVPEKAEENSFDSPTQQEMDLHKQRMQGFGYMDTEPQNGAFGKE